MDNFQWIAPLGTSDMPHGWRGRGEKKSWDYQITAAIPHLNTIEPLKICLEILRLQTNRPYLMIVDTGSPDVVCEELETLRAQDCEIHYIGAHDYCSSSEPVAAALDLAHALCRTKILFHTHTDLFLRRRDFLENFARVCTPNTPVIGYRMSPRDWATDDWKWMVGHAALLLYMPSIHRIGATWSMQRMHYAYQYPFSLSPGWPDTETGFNHALRDAGIVPVFIGHDRNHERQMDDNIDHARSFPGSKLYAAAHCAYHARAAGWMEDAMKEAKARIEEWSGGIVKPFSVSISPQTSPQYPYPY